METTPIILIVDDEPNNVVIVEKRLRAAGYQTRTAGSGVEALSLIDQELPDLVLLDVMMPGMSGFDVCERLKSNELTKDIPVVFLSARSEVDDRVEGLQRGAIDYIGKPFHPKELMARIENALQHTKALRDIKQEYTRLQAISIVDDLTGLYNRRYFMERFLEEISRAQRYSYSISCLMVDIDFFKRINDNYGHLSGDAVLAEFASILKNSTRVVDVLARFGGEEFIIFLPQTGLDGATVVANKIHENVNSHAFCVEGDTVTITVSIGAAVFAGEAVKNGMEILKQADRAMYEAKQAGRNQTCTVVFPAS